MGLTSLNICITSFNRLINKCYCIFQFKRFMACHIKSDIMSSCNSSKCFFERCINKFQLVFFLRCIGFRINIPYFGFILFCEIDNLLIGLFIQLTPGKLYHLFQGKVYHRFRMNLYYKYTFYFN